VIFVTLEDETGVANIVVWPRAFQQFRRELLSPTA
jgi:error-prone DNA polymerase